jgi:hypothetical protein
LLQHFQPNACRAYSTRIDIAGLYLWQILCALPLSRETVGQHMYSEWLTTANRSRHVCMLCSSARESTVAAGNCLLKPYGLQAEADASLAAHFSQPLMATPCSDFRADVLTPTAGSALRLDDDLDDDTAFGQSLLNPELFGDPLPLSNLPHLSSSESHQGSTAQLHQTDPSEVRLTHCVA